MIRGIASIAKLVTPADASALLVSAEVSGARCPIRTWPSRKLADLIVAGDRDVGDDLGSPGIADLGPRLGVLGVGMARALAGAGLDDDVDLLGDQRSDHVWNQRDPALVRGCFFRNPDLHLKQGVGRATSEPGQPNETVRFGVRQVISACA